LRNEESGEELIEIPELNISKKYFEEIEAKLNDVSEETYRFFLPDLVFCLKYMMNVEKFCDFVRNVENKVLIEQILCNV
jgi:hypothetical protein